MERDETRTIPVVSAFRRTNENAVANSKLLILHSGPYAAACNRHSCEYCPPFAISSSWLPDSTSFAPSSTTMRLAMRTVEKRCDTRIVMRPSLVLPRAASA